MQSMKYFVIKKKSGHIQQLYFPTPHNIKNLLEAKKES